MINDYKVGLSLNYRFKNIELSKEKLFVDKLIYKYIENMFFNTIQSKNVIIKLTINRTDNKRNTTETKRVFLNFKDIQK